MLHGSEQKAITVAGFIAILAVSRNLNQNLYVSIFNQF